MTISDFTIVPLEENYGTDFQRRHNMYYGVPYATAKFNICLRENDNEIDVGYFIDYIMSYKNGMGNLIKKEMLCNFDSYNIKVPKSDFHIKEEEIRKVTVDNPITSLDLGE
jgi:hypothetical protein